MDNHDNTAKPSRQAIIRNNARENGRVLERHLNPDHPPETDRAVWRELTANSVDVVPEIFSTFFDMFDGGATMVRVVRPSRANPGQQCYASQDYIVTSIEGRRPTHQVTESRKFSFTWHGVPNPTQHTFNDLIDTWRDIRTNEGTVTTMGQIRTVAAACAVTKGVAGTYDIPIGDLMAAYQWDTEEDLYPPQQPYQPVSTSNYETEDNDDDYDSEGNLILATPTKKE